MFYRAAFECIWVDLRGLTPEVIVNQERLRRISITIVWFLATLLLAIFIPNIGVVIELLGAFAAVFIFVFPGKFGLKRKQSRDVKAYSFTERKRTNFHLIKIILFLYL